jgi:hypothetical protein
MVPIEINVIILLKIESFAPVKFSEVPVDQTLHVIATSLDAQERDVFRDFYFGMKFGQGLSQFS